MSNRAEEPSNCELALFSNDVAIGICTFLVGGDPSAARTVAAVCLTDQLGVNPVRPVRPFSRN